MLGLKYVGNLGTSFNQSVRQVGLEKKENI